MSYNLANFALFQAGWFACVLGAARGLPWAGPAAVCAALWVHLRHPVRRREAPFIAFAVLAGTALDSAFVAAGVYAPASGSLAPWLAPPWIAALWALFACVFRHSLSWLSGRYALAAVLGLVGSPLSFAAAERLGALSLPPERTASLVVFGLSWAVAMPVLVRASERVR